MRINKSLENKMKSKKSKVPVEYGKMLHRVGKANGYDAFDLLDSLKHFDAWCDAKGYGKVDPKGEIRSHSNVWFAEYQADPKGLQACPKLLCFSDFLAEKFNLFYGEYGEAIIDIDIDELLSSAQDWESKVLEDLRKIYGNKFKCFVDW